MLVVQMTLLFVRTIVDTIVISESVSTRWQVAVLSWEPIASTVKSEVVHEMIQSLCRVETSLGIERSGQWHQNVTCDSIYSPI